MEQAPHQTSGDEQHKRLVVGWFSFTCCEDSTILFTELLNDHLDEWRKVIEFRYMKALKTNNSLAGLDVAFIEGRSHPNRGRKRRPTNPTLSNIMPPKPHYTVCSGIVVLHRSAAGARLVWVARDDQSQVS
jgi:hypothetical protein